MAAQTRRQSLQQALVAAEAECRRAATTATEAESAAAEAEDRAGEHAATVERLQATFDLAGSHQRGLQRLLHAVRQRDDANTALRAAASEVLVELEAGKLDQVRIGGRPLAEPSRSFRIVDPLEIEIAGLGRIMVRPVVPARRSCRLPCARPSARSRPS